MLLGPSPATIEAFLRVKLGRVPQGVPELFAVYFSRKVRQGLNTLIERALVSFEEENQYRADQGIYELKHPRFEDFIIPIDESASFRERVDIRPLNDDIGGGQEKGSKHESEEEPAEENGPQGGE